MFTEPLGGDFVRGALSQHSPLANVRSFGVLADDDEIVWLGVAGRRADERPLIDVQIEIEPHLQQQPTFDDPGWHIGRAHSAEQNCVEPA